MPIILYIYVKKTKSTYHFWRRCKCEDYQRDKSQDNNYYRYFLYKLSAFYFRFALAVLLYARRTLLSWFIGHDYCLSTLTTILSSSNWPGSRTDGASIMVSRPELFFGNAIQSRIESRPANRLTQRSRPYAKPP